VFEPGDSMGLGLSVCYGIVREHGGEISAFNMHPHGAALAVELPVAGSDKNYEVVAGERAYSESV
jgi:K+-sensing histidine kinase KdpD